MSSLSGLKRSLIKIWIEELWCKGNSAVVDELHSVDFKDRGSAGRSHDNNGFKKGINELYSAFPDFFTEVEDLIMDDEQNKVVIRWKATGTHKGTFMGFPPTNRQIIFRGIDILRIENNKIVERWGEWDGIDILTQLGVKKEKIE